MQRVVLILVACLLGDLSATQSPHKLAQIVTDSKLSKPRDDSRLVRRDIHQDAGGQAEGEGEGAKRVAERLMLTASASLMQKTEKKSEAKLGVDAEPEFLNGSFEDITKSTDSSGVETLTNLMPPDASGALTARTAVAGDAGNMGGWQFSGNVKLVATDDATYGGLDAPEGGIFVSLQDHNAEISQEIDGHIFEAGTGGAAAKGGFYQLSFMAATKPKTAAQLAAMTPSSPVALMEVHLEGAKSKDISAVPRTAGSGTTADVDPDWTVQPLATFQGYNFVYEAEAKKVNIIVKNQSPNDGNEYLVLLDDFSIRACGETLEEAKSICGDDGESVPLRSDCTQADGTFIAGCQPSMSL